MRDKRCNAKQAEHSGSVSDPTSLIPDPASLIPHPSSLIPHLILAAWLAGCSGSTPTAPKEKTTGAVPRISPPPPRAAPAADPEPEVAPAAPAPRHPVGPWLEYRVASSDRIEAKGYLRFLTTPGFDSVLELSSYDAVAHEEFPSLYVRAVTKSEKLADLVQQKLTADLYVMVEKDGNLIHTLPAQPLELVISEIDGKNVRGTFTGQVHDIDLGGEGPIAGKFQAIVE